MAWRPEYYAIRLICVNFVFIMFLIAVPIALYGTY